MQRKWLWGVVALLAAALPLAVFLRQPPAPFTDQLPQPNGYDDLVQAAFLLQSPRADWAVLDGLENPDFANWVVRNHKPWIECNSNAWERLELGLARECRVPVQAGQNYMSGRMTRLPALKTLANALLARAHLAEAEGQTNQSVHLFLDVVRLGQKSAVGGLVIDARVGIAIENMGLRVLEQRVSELDRAACLQALKDLQAADLGWEDPMAFLERDEAWARATYRHTYWILRLSHRIRWPGSVSSQTQIRQRVVSLFHYTARRQRALVLALARRAYELDYGRPPTNPKELAPDYLQFVPKDPDAGQSRPLPSEGGNGLKEE